MKRIFILALLCLLALAAMGCRVVSGGNYILSSGQVLSGDLSVTGGDARLEQGSRVTGSLLVTGGSTIANGQIDGNVSVNGGSINFGPSAVVRGVVQKTGGGVNIAPGAQVRYGDAFATGIQGGSIWNVVTGMALIPLLLVAILIVLLATRTSRVTVAQPAERPAAGEAGPAPAPPGLPSPAERGTGLGGNVVLAVILIGLGILFLLQELLNVDVWRYSWPYLVIAAGLLFFAAMVLGGRGSARLAVPGAIVTVAGLILLYQNTFDLFESWAYAWALIFPTSIGIGHFIEGWWGDRPDLREKGIQETRTGLIIFIIFAAFFELVLNLSGFYYGDYGRLVFPALLILIGVLLLLGRFMNWPGPRQRPV